MADLPDYPDLTWLPLGLDEIPRWHALYDAAKVADAGDEHLTADDLVDELDADWIDLDRDSVLGVDAAGVARAFGLVQLRPGDVTELRVHCWGVVHPEARGRGLGTALLAWQERVAARLVATRRAELAAAPPGYAWLGVSEPVEDAARLAARAGFTLTRWNSVMRRDLSLPGPDVPALPDGMRILPWSPDLDDSIRLAHNEAFLDHWGFQPWSRETWEQWESGYRWFRKDFTFALLDRDEVAGYATGAGYEPDWVEQGFTEGWTSKLGVRRAWRGRGLAKALLAAQFAAFRSAGLQHAGLDVDTESLTGAMALYEGLGYASVRRSASWHKAL